MACCLKTTRPLLLGRKIVKRSAVYSSSFHSGSSTDQRAAEKAAKESSSLEMPPCDFKPEPYNGPSYDKVKAIRKANLSPAWLTHFKEPLLFHQGHMQWLFDHTGRRYLDLIGGIVTVSVGHCHPKVTAALQRQSNLLWHTTGIYMHPRVHEYAEKLASKMPGDLKVVYFVNSGSEANDLAMLMSRLHTGRYEILSFQGAYHGASPTLMGLTALNTWRYNTPTGFGIHQTLNPDVYQGQWGGSNCRDSPIQTCRSCSCGAGQCQAEDKYVNALHDVIKYCVPKKGLAGFFAESIQGVGGTVQYPRGFLKRAFELVRSKGGVCISDEVQTGFGRTGDHYWGFQGHDVMPDIVTMAKGIGNGFPLAAVVTTPQIASTLTEALHFNTYGGDPLASAVGSAVLDVIDEDKSQQNSAIVGTLLLKELAKLRDEFEIVGDVRGKGLMVGMEMVTDKKTQTPLQLERMSKIWDGLKDMGVLIGKGGLHGTVFRIKPPMCITEADVKYFIGCLRRILPTV